jgi:hypothetical protein
MLGRAQERVIHQGFSNVELVQADLAGYDFPSKIGGAVTTYSLEMICCARPIKVPMTTAGLPSASYRVENFPFLINVGENCCVTNV